MRKNICFFSGDITRSGGTERVAVQLANALHPTHNVCFLSLTEQQPQPFFPLDETIPRFHLSEKWIAPGPGYLPLIGKLRKFLKERKIDIIIDIDIVLDVLSIPAARRVGTKVISWEHFNVEFEQSVLYRRLILDYSVKRSDYIVTLTNGDLEAYQTRLGRKDAIRRIYNPVAYQLQTGSPPQPQKLLLTVGRLVPEKGIKYLKEVALRVLERHPDWQWLLLGEGPERESLARFIQEHHLQERLILKGNVENVDDYLRRASIFVVTSQYEGLGLSILEARALKVPCVCFDVKTGPKELIHNGVDGYLVPPFDCEDMADKIELLMRSPALRHQFAEQAFLCMDEFRTDRIVSQWQAVLKSLT